MKVAYFHYGIFEGGDSNGWYRTYELAKGLIELGHRVDLYTTGSKSEFGSLTLKNMNGVQVCVFGDILTPRFQRGGFSLTSLITKVRYAKNSGKYDMVVCDNVHRPSCLIPSFYLKIFKGTPIVSEWWELFGKRGIYSDLGWKHKVLVGFYDLLLEKPIRKRCDGLATISEYLAAEAKYIGCNSESIEIIHAGSHRHLCERGKIVLSPPQDELLIGLVGFNRDELYNNVCLFETVKELHHSGLKIKVICSGHEDLQETIPIEYRPFVKLLGWIDYDEFISIFNSCHVLTLLQENKIRNQARFPNKFGDYISFRGVILTNGVGDLANYVTKYPNKVQFAESKQEIKSVLLNIVKNGMPNMEYEICKENTWLKKAEQLENLFGRIKEFK